MSNSTREQRQLVFQRLIGKSVAGKYTITGLLGFGGMGAVYEAVQMPMERKVALKLIPTFDPTATTRFEREATTVSKLSHPNTVTVFDFGQTEDGHLYLSMEHLVGHTLTDLIKSEGPLSAQRVVHIATQICRALGEAHRVGIIHRDIKPDNIFLIQVDKDPDYVKVLDFGIAKAIHGEESADLTADGRIIGTPRYMSPEQILASPIDHRVDIYSLGCILFEMVCGNPPFTGNNTAALMMSHAQQRPPTFSERLTPQQLQNLPAGLEAVVQRTLAKNPNARPQTTDELLKELEQALRINQAYSTSQHQPYGTGQHVPMPHHSGPQHTGPHTGQHHYTGQNTGQQQFAAEPFVQTGSFEHNTGDFSHSTGNFQQHFGPNATQTGTQNTFAPPAPEQNKSKSKTPIIIGVVVVLLFIGLGVAYNSMINKKDPQQPTQPKTDVAKNTTPKTTPKTTDTKTKDVAPVDKVAKQLKFRVRTSPSEADIFDGSTFVGSTPYTLTLKSDGGKKTYTIRLKKYKEAKFTVDPSKPEDNFFDIDLVPNSSKRKTARVKIRRSKRTDTKEPEKTTQNTGSKTKSKGGEKADTKPQDEPKTTPKTNNKDKKDKKSPVIERLDDDEKNQGIDRL